MTHADADKHVAALYWEQDGGTLRILARQPDWTPNDPEDLYFAVEVIGGDVPLAGWEELARVFLTHFGR